jgi:hypothetical protein
MAIPLPNSLTKCSPYGDDLGRPLFLIRTTKHLVVVEEDELDGRKPVTFKLGEGAVHHRRHEAFVEAAKVADTFDHDFLEHRSPCFGWL